MPSRRESQILSFKKVVPRGKDTRFSLSECHLGKMTKGKSLGCISKSKYDVIVAKIKGEFKVPIKQRTKDQLNALWLFRKRNDFSVGEDGRLLCSGKKVIVEEELPKLVEETFKRNNGCGSRVLWVKLKESYTGFSENRITEILYRSSYYHKQYPRFTNKPLPKTVKSSASNHRWQIDILNMKGFEVQYERSTYKFILQVIDVHSRYVMPQPLQSKASAEVAAALEKVMLDHGFPRIIQCDNGTEFQGKAVKLFLEKHDIRMINSRPYYPQSQGKCERSNQSLKRKILFACRRKAGFNWARDLKHIAHSMNTSAKRVLGNMTPFQVYHGRNHTGEPTLSNREVKRKLATASKSFRRRQLKGAKKPSRYTIGEKVLLRYPFTKSRVPTKRHILIGIIKDAKSLGRYLVQFDTPKYRNKVTVQEWVGVENITSLTLETERQKQRKVNEHSQRRSKDESQKKLHRARYYKVLNHADKLQMLDSEFQNGVKVLMNPEPNGNCQFAAIKHQLQLHGIYRDESALRKESVDHLSVNRYFYEKFVHGTSFCDYLKQMSQDGSYGDNLTLIAIMREYNMQCLVLSASGIEHSTLVSNDGIYDINLPLITLGHFPEDEGMHYVSVSADVEHVLQLLEETVSPTPEQDSPFNAGSKQTLNEETGATADSEMEPERSPSGSEPVADSEMEPERSPSGSEPAADSEMEPERSPSGSEPAADSEMKSERSPSGSEPAADSEMESERSPSGSEPVADSEMEPERSPSGSEPAADSEMESERSPSGLEPAADSEMEPERSPSGSEQAVDSEMEPARSLGTTSAVTTQTLESFRTQRATLINIRRQTRKIKERRFSYKLLPILVQEMIVSKILDQNPAMRFVLEKVDRHFVDLIKSMNIPRPRIYVSPALLDNVPNPVSVRYFLIHLGRNSGVIQEIKRTIKEPTWANAWLRLRASGIHWYDIVDIYYTRR